MKRTVIEFDDDNFKTCYEGVDSTLEVLGMLRLAESEVIESIKASDEIRDAKVN